MLALLLLVLTVMCLVVTAAADQQRIPDVFELVLNLPDNQDDGSGFIPQ
jgi:hypothetical protein